MRTIGAYRDSAAELLAANQIVAGSRQDGEGRAEMLDSDERAASA